MRGHAVSPELVLAARAIAVDRATAEVVRALRACDIPCILLKGPALVRALYAPGEARPYRDVDLLVRRADAAAAEAVFGKLGFTGPGRGAFQGTWEPVGVEYMRASDGVVVDVHTTLHGAHAPHDAVWRAVAGSLAQMAVSGVEVDALSGPALAFEVAAHAAHHGREVAKPLRDLRRALERMDEGVWRQAAAFASLIAADGAFAEGLRLDPAGEDLLARLELSGNRQTEAVLRAQSPPVSALGWERVLRAEGMWARARALRREVLPPPRYVRAQQPAVPGRAGLPRAYALRALRLAREAPGALRAVRQARSEARSPLRREARLDYRSMDDQPPHTRE